MTPLVERGRSLRFARVVALAIAVSASAFVRAEPPAPRPGEELVLASDLRVRVVDGRSLVLRVLPGRGEGYASVARRVTGSPANADAIADVNLGEPASVDRFVDVPFAILSDEYRSLVLMSVFPEDRIEDDAWVHVARGSTVPVYAEGLWQVALWFTGDGERHADIAARNGLQSPELRQGQEIRIPLALLHPALRPLPSSDDGSLRYGQDEDGAYAGYRLRKGEALYSSVVVRFTGRTSAEDVEAAAEAIAERSGIRDLRDIPVGYLVKIPFDLLEPEFLPPDAPRRREAEARRAEVAAEMARPGPPRARRDLQDVIVILDPGHGGRDLGTMNHGLWEHDYVYDVACRLKRILERETSARVEMTLEDRETGFAPSGQDRLVANREGSVLTDPPFLARQDGEAVIGVNLRWYLANSILRRAAKDGVPAERVLFVSLHADARHPSLRGVMVYVPGARFRQGTHGRNTKTYRKYREVREEPRVTFPHRERIRSEAVSRRFAARVVTAFNEKGLPVQTIRPVRDKVIRGRSTWLPAVLRGNAVPAKVLIEMVNLSNPADAALLGKARERERLAEALSEAIVGYFRDGEADSRSRSR